MFRRLAVVASVTSLFVVLVATPSNAIIHELVASHCAGHDLPNNGANVDPPGQLNQRGNSFARALQATGIYSFAEGADEGGTFGLDFTQDPPVFGPMPAPDGPSVVVTVDPTKPSAKLGDSFVWIYFKDGPLNIYLQAYDLDHPAFDDCPGIHP